ncbi:MAG: phosphoserine phosphatase SerB [Rhodospirillaceae bacterium]
MDQVLTLVAPRRGDLTADIVAEAVAALNGLGAAAGAPTWLADGEAADVPFSGVGADVATKAVNCVTDGRALDLHAGPADGRRKRLLLADMDSTIVTSETLDDLAAHAGLKDKVAAITARAMNGELDFAAAVRERVGMLAGLPEAVLDETFAATTLTGGAVTLVRTMRANGARCVLVSGGFKYFTQRVADACGCHENHANGLIVADGRLTGEVAEPILDKHAKLATLERLTAELGLTPAQTLCVGDGANDLPMIAAAGLGVAFRGKPVVAAAAPARIEHADLTALLFYQGYRRDDFVDATTA